MKTKELIKLLQEEDPSGEIEVSCDGAALLYVDNLPAYYDGSLQVLIRDESKSIVGVEFIRNGRKIAIHTYNWKDFLWDNMLCEKLMDKIKFDHEPFQRKLDEIQKEIKEFKRRNDFILKE